MDNPSKEIVKTTQLEFDKSNFLVDLVQHSSGSHYVEVVQVIKDQPHLKQTLKINPSILSDLIKVLQTYHAKIHDQASRKTIHLVDADQQKIVERYLKGVTINDLCVQFDQEEVLIRMVLRNKGIPLDMIEKPEKRRHNRKRK